MKTLAQRFVDSLQCDEFTKRELFVELGTLKPSGGGTEIHFSDGSVAFNKWISVNREMYVSIGVY